MPNPILVKGAAGRVGAAGRTVRKPTLKQGKAVRAMVRSEDERAEASCDIGTEVVVGDPLDLDSMHRTIDGCETIYFGLSNFEAHRAAIVKLHWLAEQALNWSGLPFVRALPTVFFEGFFQHEARTGQADPKRPEWYAEYMVREQSGERLP